MKVLCVIDSLGSGGAQKQIIEIAKGLKSEGYEVEFLTYYNHSFFKKILDDAKIKVNIVNRNGILGRLFGIINFLRNNRPNVIISFLEIPTFFCELASFFYKPSKLIVGERSADPKILNSFKRRCLRFLHFRADFVVANSQSNIDIVKKCNKFLQDEKLKVIYNIIDPEYQYNEELKSCKPDGICEIIVVASHQYLKNAKGMIKAVALLSNEDRAKIRISWYGEKNRDGSFKEAALLVEENGLGNTICFYDHTRDIYDKILNSDILALFSYYEGFPNVIGEAMCLGKPVISSDISDISSILDKQFIFDPNNIEEVSKALSFVSNLDKTTLIEIGNRNKDIAKTLFDRSKNLKLYKDLINA